MLETDRMMETERTAFLGKTPLPGTIYPGMLIPVNPDLAIDIETARAFADLYLGMREASSNGTGYSPQVADAMKRLKELLSPELIEKLKT